MGKPAGKQAGKQAGKHWEGIQSEPCPGGACSKVVVVVGLSVVVVVVCAVVDLVVVDCNGGEYDVNWFSGDIIIGAGEVLLKDLRINALNYLVTCIMV